MGTSDLLNIFGTGDCIALLGLNHCSTLDGRRVALRAVAFTDRDEDGLVRSVRPCRNAGPLLGAG